MKIYLANAYSLRHEMNAVAGYLRVLGHSIVSRWHSEPHRWDRGDRDGGLKLALDDLDDLERSDCVVCYCASTAYLTSGGHHWEFGWAYAQDKRLILVGARANVFHCLPSVEVFRDTQELLTRLAGEQYAEPPEITAEPEQKAS